MDQKASVGRIVHYVLASRDARPDSAGMDRAALVTGDPSGGWVNLTVFLDGDIDGLSETGIIRVNAEYSEDLRPGTWHWPPRV